ncbi:MAG: VOC family protein [Candidatus Eremiobacteraeota bacterium]|nr:VOC family protein [Candidatus Eremiobacteraeota bacterium]
MATATGVKITGIDFHGYLVKDAARAIKFYKETLGLKPTYEMEQGAEFELEDGSTFGVWRMDDAPWHPGSGVFFAVPNLHEAVEHLKTRGVKFLDEKPAESPVCHMIAAEDTEGNFFMLHQRKQQ